MKVGIVDYQASNLGSLSSALTEAKINHYVSADPKDFKTTELMLLPGVGSFAMGMQNLISSGMENAIKLHCEENKPILGICLGMHLLATMGSEGGLTRGLNLIPGEIVKLEHSESFRVPHMGWDMIQYKNKKSYVYFAHSYYFKLNENFPTNVLSQFGTENSNFPAHIQLKNIAGIQFHPEKSGHQGLEILCDAIASLL